MSQLNYNKKFLFITTSRADYGQSKNLILKLKKRIKKNFFLLVSGSHLSKKSGKTINEILNDGIKPDFKLDILKEKRHHISDNGKIAEVTLKKFNHFFLKFKPDLVILLGDRFEMLPIAYAAYLKNIKIAHINGGEVTEGSIDEGIRHSITKLSFFHFASTNENRNRIINLGENPKRVFNVGSLGVESLLRNKFISKFEIQKNLNILFQKKNLILTFHPETFETVKKNIKYVKKIIQTLKKLKSINFFITSSNIDSSGLEINKLFKLASKKFKNFYFFESLGKDNYFSLLKYSDGVIGNSSSGIIEVPSLKKGVINLGTRQQSRSKNPSIINSKINFEDIIKSIKKLYSKNYQKKLKTNKNEYEKSNSSTKICNILLKCNLMQLNNKKFFNIRYEKNYS